MSHGRSSHANLQIRSVTQRTSPMLLASPDPKSEDGPFTPWEQMTFMGRRPRVLESIARRAGQDGCGSLPRKGPRRKTKAITLPLSPSPTSHGGSCECAFAFVRLERPIPGRSAVGCLLQLRFSPRSSRATIGAPPSPNNKFCIDELADTVDRDERTLRRRGGVIICREADVPGNRN